MTIRMYDVHFGDCFLLEEQNECLLVDFGSIDSNFNLDAVANNISTQIQGKEFSVLLTHFHEDHMNGLGHLLNILDTTKIAKFYLPSVVCMNIKRKMKYSFLQVSIISDFLQSLVLQKENPEITIYSLLLSLIQNNAKVIFLKRDDTFTCDQTDYEVLWPSCAELDVDYRICESLDKLFTGERRIGLDLEKIGLLIERIVEFYQIMSTNDEQSDLKNLYRALQDSMKLLH